MTSIDLDYYRMRFAAEQRAAAEAHLPLAAAIHRELAERYAALIDELLPVAAE
jgi:hypothetical protein